MVIIPLRIGIASALLAFTIAACADMWGFHDLTSGDAGGRVDGSSGGSGSGSGGESADGAGSGSSSGSSSGSGDGSGVDAAFDANITTDAGPLADASTADGGADAPIVDAETEAGPVEAYCCINILDVPVPEQSVLPADNCIPMGVPLTSQNNGQACSETYGGYSFTGIVGVQCVAFVTQPTNCNCPYVPNCNCAGTCSD